jgi:hypothetical protein
METTRRHRLLPALAAMTLVAAACSAPAAPSPSPSRSVSPEPSEPPSSPTPSPSQTPAPLPEFVLERATVPADVPGFSAIQGIGPGGDGLLAIGHDGAFGSMVWTSADGRDWRDITPSGFESAGIIAVIRFAGGLLAVGRGNTTDFESELAAAWISADGYQWRQVADSPALRGQMIDVVETDAGLIAVGGIPVADAAGAWRSTDGGETWQRIGEDIEHAFLWAVSEGGPGLVASGWRRDPEPTLAVWTSDDGGQTWTLAPEIDGGSGFEGTDLLAGPDGRLVMVGGLVEGGEARIWTSTDGLAWTVAEVSVSLQEAGLRSVMAAPFGLVALGYREMNGAALVSTDGGRSWQPLAELEPEAYFTSALVTDAGQLLIGGAMQQGTPETGIDAHAMIWVAR